MDVVLWDVSGLVVRLCYDGSTVHFCTNMLAEPAPASFHVGDCCRAEKGINGLSGLGNIWPRGFDPLGYPSERLALAPLSIARFPMQSTPSCGQVLLGNCQSFHLSHGVPPLVLPMSLFP